MSELPSVSQPIEPQMPNIPPMDRRPSTKYEENPAWKCDHHKSGSGVRNLIVCIDGTANQFGKKNTNVIELYNLILKEEEDKQLTWYNSGIGTYARPSWWSFKYFCQVIGHKIDLAIAWNFERTILAAYRWLSENYQKGDRIFLFGFSRGAFQVRVLAAMIHKVGLIRKGNEEQIPFAYELYADPESDKPSTEVTNVGSTKKQQGSPEKGKNTITTWFEKIVSRKRANIHAEPRSNGDLPDVVNVGSEAKQQRSPQHQATTMAARFKKAFSHNGVHVHYVGVWDTVSSIGIARGKCMLPGTVNGMKHVCYFRQALALDERRVKFAPEYAYGGSATSSDNPQDKAVPATFTGNPKAAPQRPTLTVPPSSTDHLTSALVDVWGSFTSPLESIEDLTSDFNSNSEAAPSVSAVLPVEGTDDLPEERFPSRKKSKGDIPPCTLEVWFAGTHSDIGGGNALNEAMDRSRPPLRWMVFEAASAGLRTEPFQRVLPSDEQIEVQESLTGVWWLLEVLPIKRLTYTRKKNGKKTTYRPHFGGYRKIHHGQKIHGSLILTNKQTNEYTPKARPPDDHPDLWSKLHTEGLGEWKAVDLFEGTQDLLNKFVDQPDDHVWEHLQKTAALTVDGRQAVYDAAIGTLLARFTPPTAPLPIKIQLLSNVMDILETNKGTANKLTRCDVDEVKAVFGDCRENKDSNYISIARRFIVHFTTFQIQPKLELRLAGFRHFLSFKNLAMFSDDRVIFSLDKTCHIWEPVTGLTAGFSVERNSSPVSRLAASPDGKVFVSGLRDGTICFWTDQMSLISSAKGHTALVESVAFSPTGMRVASGSFDGTVRIWDVAHGSQVGQSFETGAKVRAVMFTHGGEKIMSLSQDQTVRVWDVATRSMVGEPLRLSGHLDAPISCGAFSSNGKAVVVGTAHGEVMMWNLDDAPVVGKPCTPHEGSSWISFIVFSPDNKKVASASSDETIHIVNTETQELECILHHDRPVQDVSFSPDGQRVASSCRDRKIRIWDIEPLLW